jgi:hypothetical protein
MSATETKPLPVAEIRHARPRITLRPHWDLPWLALPDGVGSQVIIDAVPVPVPNTRTWFSGVISVQGNLLPIFDLGLWADLTPIDRQYATIVALGQGIQACGLLCVSSPKLMLDLEPAPAGQDRDLGKLSPFLGARAQSLDGSVIDFDYVAWLIAAAQGVSSTGLLGGTA